MRTDGLFTIHSITIPTRIGDPNYLIPLGDIHRDSESHAETEFRECLEYIRKERKGAYVLGMADYNDFLRAHERAIVESATGEKARDALNRYAEQCLAVIRDELRTLPVHWVGLLSGNHYAEITRKDHNGERTVYHSDRLLADALRTKYLGVCAAITVTLRDARRNKQAKIVITAHHGVGTGSTIGGSMNRVQRWLDGWNASIALMGDNHQRGIMPSPDRLGVEKNVLTHQRRYIGRTGSFQRGYVPNLSNYVTDKALLPTSLGWIEIELRLQMNPKTGIPYVGIRGIS